MEHERGPSPTWEPPQPPGHLGSIQAIGTVAAPLLAAVVFTMIALVLPSTGSTDSFSRWPEASLALLALAGFLLISTVQASAWTRRYECTPDDLRAWWPEHFNADGTPDTWVTRVQADQLRNAEMWAERARMFYHAGILCLLAGLAVLVIPPGEVPGARWVLLGVTTSSVAGELYWILYAEFTDPARRRLAVANAVVIAAFLFSLLANVLHGTDEMTTDVAGTFTICALAASVVGSTAALGVSDRSTTAGLLLGTLVAATWLFFLVLAPGTTTRWLSVALLAALAAFHGRVMRGLVRTEHAATS
ncbi:MAG TPA: hypothetical protein VFD59_13825 [Nocardioidaceae bacterium]|nr:hypothetical protein [Nocardioidaceae bacterium]